MINAEKRAVVRALWFDMSLTVDQIGAHFNTKRHSVNRMARRMGLPDRRKLDATHRRRVIDQDATPELVILYKAGVRYAALARFFGCTEAAIAQAVKRLADAGKLTRRGRGYPGLSVEEALEQAIIGKMKRTAQVENAARK